MNKELYEISNRVDEVNEWINLISNFAEIETLTRPIITELIDKITVSERVIRNGEWEQAIDINYRFVGNLLQNAEITVKEKNIA